MIDVVKHLPRRRWAKIIVDVSLLVGFLGEFVTREGPDYTVHSWLGIVLVPIIVVHLSGNIGWIKRVVSRGRQDREFSLAVLNAVLGSLTAVCIITGLSVWRKWSTSGLWGSVHTITGFACIILMFIHLWRNRSRIGGLLRARPASVA